MSESFTCVMDSKSKLARFSSKTLGALIMVKNEENSIQQTIQSLKNVVSDVIVLDTGSTDKTIDIIKATCLKNNQTLHLKISTFKTFPESRNESIEFAETVDVENLIMLDAGDEFKCDISISEWLSIVKTIPTGYNFGVVKLKWLESNNLTEHYDIRLIKNRKGCRYDLIFPVHEKFANIQMVHYLQNFALYQNRDKYSESTSRRIAKDIELLSKAKPHSRNYYYLAQSYIVMKDYKNGFKYNLMVLDFEDQDYDKIMVYSRLMRCAIECKMSSKLVIKYFKLAIDEPNNPQMEPFINFFRYCMQENILELTLPYLKQLSELVKPSTRDFGHKDYDYTRWLLIYQICLMTRTNRDIGQIACNKAIQAQNNECDKMNLSLFQNIPNTIPNMITIDAKLETKPAANVETKASNKKEMGMECCRKILMNENSSPSLIFSTFENIQFYDVEPDATLFEKVDELICSLSREGHSMPPSASEVWNKLINKVQLTKYNPIKNKSKMKSPKIILTMTTCKRFDLFQQTINSITNTWTDIDMIDYWFCVDDNSSQEDRTQMKKKYNWIDYYMKCPEEKGHRNSMNIIWDKLNELRPTYWIHIEDDFRFHYQMDYIKTGIKYLENDIKQVLFNRNYGEQIKDYSILGHATYHATKEIVLHDHKNGFFPYQNCHYWTDYSFRPSIIKVDAILELGNYDSVNHFFEKDYADKWYSAGFRSAFFNRITCEHIGKLTTDKKGENAYTMNDENQFVKKTETETETETETKPKIPTKFEIKVVNMERRLDRKEETIAKFKEQNITDYKFIEAIDGQKLDLSAYLSSKGFNNLEGNVGECPPKYLDLIELTKKPIVNVMEIGFNGGHSAELFLKNNDDIHLTSFDIGAHTYLLKGKEYIDARYPNRHTLILGDSKITVANFYKNNKDKKFDFIFIDGGHDYETAKADMENCFHLAHKDTIVALDDTIYRQDWTQFWNIGPTLTWMQHLEQNKITELNRVEYAHGQGMSWGKYIF